MKTGDWYSWCITSFWTVGKAVLHYFVSDFIFWFSWSPIFTWPKVPHMRIIWFATNVYHIMHNQHDYFMLQSICFSLHMKIMFFTNVVIICFLTINIWDWYDNHVTIMLELSYHHMNLMIIIWIEHHMIIIWVEHLMIVIWIEHHMIIICVEHHVIVIWFEHLMIIVWFEHLLIIVWFEHLLIIIWIKH